MQILGRVGEGTDPRCGIIEGFRPAEGRYHGTGRVDVDAMINRARHHMLGLFKVTR